MPPAGRSILGADGTNGPPVRRARPSSGDILCRLDGLTDSAAVGFGWSLVPMEIGAHLVPIPRIFEVAMV
jgi:hypothetical protein